MAEIHIKKIGNDIVTLFEDPVLSNNRLFLSTVGHDTTTLAPLFQKNFHFNREDRMDRSYDAGITNDMGIMYLEKAVVQCWAPSSDGFYDNFWQAPYHQSLDPAFYPVKKHWKTVNNRILYSVPMAIPGASTTGTSTTYGYVYPTTDITSGAGASYYVANIFGTAFIYEDVSNNKMWCFKSGGGEGHYVETHTNYETAPAVSTITPPNNTRMQGFFLGVDDGGFLHFVGVQDGASYYSQYTFWKVNPTTNAVTTVINQSVRTASGTTGPRHWPSNIRRATTTRRVLYSGHYDSSNNLAPIRYVWNPADGSVTATNCTMTYSGANTYATYSARYTTEDNSTYSWYSWHSKGHQFTVSGTNYITFWITDKMAHTGNGLTRWGTAQKRTMMTYTIGSGTGDDTLTYHSSYTFPTVNDIPRDFLPINSEGTQVAVPVTLQMRFFSFNTSTGWSPTGTYPYEFRTIGLDQTNRIWGISKEKGNNTLHMITPTLPITINVVMASISYTFTGSNISTSCTVDAYGADGLRLAAAINLAIDGGSMIFASTGTKNIVVNTSASATTTVNLTITGGGINNIIASIDI